LLKIPMVR